MKRSCPWEILNVGEKKRSLIKSDSKVSYVIIGGQSNIMQSNLAIRKIVSKISWTHNNNLRFTSVKH